MCLLVLCHFLTYSISCLFFHSRVVAKAMDGTFTIGQGKGVGDEPPMFLQRPSSVKSQDVTHILARTFRELYTKEVVASDTIQYLNVSRGGEDEFHESYVIALQKVR